MVNRGTLEKARIDNTLKPLSSTMMSLVKIKLYTKTMVTVANMSSTDVTTGMFMSSSGAGVSTINVSNTTEKLG